MSLYFIKLINDKKKAVTCYDCLRPVRGSSFHLHQYVPLNSLLPTFEIQAVIPPTINGNDSTMMKMAAPMCVVRMAMMAVSLATP